MLVLKHMKKIKCKIQPYQSVESRHHSQGSKGLAVFKSGLKVDKPTMRSKVDHRAVFVMLAKPATNQFTVESF